MSTYKKIFKSTWQKVNSGRVLPIAFVSAIAAFMGWGGSDNGQEYTEHTPEPEAGGILPRAHADALPQQCYTCTSCGCDGCEACGCDGCCFPSSAKVVVPNGVTLIKELKEGDQVVSYDETTNTFTTSVVGTILKHSNEHDFTAHPLMEMVYDKDGVDRTVVVTGNHPLYSPSAGDYQPTSEFKVGDAVKTQTGDGTITALTTLDEQEYFKEAAEITVYNLSLVEGPPTYVADGIVVHNKGCDCDCEGTCGCETE